MCGKALHVAEVELLIRSIGLPTPCQPGLLLSIVSTADGQAHFRPSSKRVQRDASEAHIQEQLMSRLTDDAGRLNLEESSRFSFRRSFIQYPSLGMPNFSLS